MPIGAILISILQATINIGLAIILIPISLMIWGLDIGGLNGAAIALAANFVVSILLTFMLLRPALKIRVRIRKTIADLAIFALFLLATIAVLKYTDIHENLVGFIVISTYAICLVISGVLSKEMWILFRQIMGKKSAVEP